MSNSIGHWWGNVSPWVGRRKAAINVVSQLEQLEQRLVLTRGGSILPVADAGALVADELVIESPVDTTSHSAVFRLPAGARKNQVIDIKQWQGTWNVSTDVPFLGNGTMQIRQLSEKNFEVTTTGLSGNQFYAVKANKDGLHFKMKGTDLEGKPKVVGFQVALNESTLSSFSGVAKVSGGNHPHSILATRQPGTGPTESNIEIVFLKSRETTRAGEYTLIFGINNLGPAPIPEGGLQVLVSFNDYFSVASYYESSGLLNSVPSSPTPGQLLVTSTTKALTGGSNYFVIGQITVDVSSDFTVIATVVDANDPGTAPNIPLTTETFSVTVKARN